MGLGFRSKVDVRVLTSDFSTHPAFCASAIVQPQKNSTMWNATGIAISAAGRAAGWRHRVITKSSIRVATTAGIDLISGSFAKRLTQLGNVSICIHPQKTGYRQKGFGKSKTLDLEREILIRTLKHNTVCPQWGPNFSERCVKCRAQHKCSGCKSCKTRFTVSKPFQCLAPCLAARNYIDSQ